MAEPAQAVSADYPSLREAWRVWIRVALLSFGGPAGQISMMHRILVEERRWISERRFLHALNFCMLLPGPEAQQLAIYIGWLMHRTVGGIIAGVLFVLPGLLAIMVLSWIYAIYGETGWVQGMFFGLKAAVLAIVIQALLRIAGRTLKSARERLLALSAFVAIYAFAVPFPLIIIAAALIGLLANQLGIGGFGMAQHHPEGGSGTPEQETALGEQLPEHAQPNRRRAVITTLTILTLWLTPVLALLFALGPEHVYSRVALVFSQMAVLSFGGAYAVLAWMAQVAVEGEGWLTAAEMLDGLGMAESTPGPLIMVTQFVGFMALLRDSGSLSPLLAATLGGLLTTWVTFAPCFLWVLVGGPYMERLRGHKALSSALSAITAAVVGVIANLALWFAVHTLFGELESLAWAGLQLDLPVWESLRLPALILAAAALLILLRRWAGLFTVLGAAVVLGVLLQWLGWAI